MNGGKVEAQEQTERHNRAVHLVDAVAIRKALLGTPVALTELERGAVVSICDTYGLSRDLVADGLVTTSRQVARDITYRRRDLSAAERELVSALMRPVARALVDAVARRDAETVARLTAGLDAEEWCALALNLAADVLESRGGAR